MAHLKVRIHALRRACAGYQNEEFGIDIDGTLDTGDADQADQMYDWLFSTANAVLDRQQAEAETRLKAQAERLNGAPVPAPAPARSSANGNGDGGGYRNAGNGNGGYKSSNGGGGGGSYNRGGGGSRNGGGGGGFGPPKDARQLLGWAKKKNIDTNDLSAWGEECGAGKRIMDWTEDDVAAAYAAFK